MAAWTALTWGTARFAVTAAATLLALAIAPAALGCRAVVVVSGSMHPQVWVGDVLVTRPLGHQLPRRGQVLLVDDPTHPGRLVSHRLVRINPDGTLMLKGDANPSPDSTPVPPSAVHGVAVLRVPLIGMPTIWRAQQQTLPLAATTLLALSAGWMGLRPAPGGRGRGPAARRNLRPDLPRGRHKNDAEPPALPVCQPLTTGLDGRTGSQPVSASPRRSVPAPSHRKWIEGLRLAPLASGSDDTRAATGLKEP